MKFTDDYHDKLRDELRDTNSVAYQLWQRVEELKANHLNAAVQAGDTDYEKGKLAAFGMLADEISGELDTHKTITPGR